MKILLVISLSFVAFATQAENKDSQVNNEDKINMSLKDVDASVIEIFKNIHKRRNKPLPGTPEFEKRFEKSIPGLITRYNNGFINQDLEAVLSCLGQSFFKITMQEGPHPAVWRPDLFHSGDDLKEWVESYLNIRPYENQITVQRVKPNGNGNLVHRGHK